ncbi:MAG TPA: acetate/propionate family kinase [Acidimicrobiales bacterium]
MSDDVLVVNVGSSSVKLQVVDTGGARAFSSELPTPVDPMALDELIAGLGPVRAVGHRVVHGGPDHVEPELVTDELLAELDDVARLAPLHDPPALAVVRLVRRLHPELPAVVCFDTAFHATLPPAARHYAVPARWEDELGIRRYGFHGLNHRYVAHRAAELLGREVEDLKLVTCHLGAGASLTAVDGGRSVDTTMGFTPLSGLVMATRSGEVDPGAVLWLLREARLDPAEIEDQLWHHSGLAGLSGRSGDLREVLAGADDGDERCRLALDVYVHRLRSGIASMVAALGGLDAVVFTGGVGERSARIRAVAVAGLSFLGLSVDVAANDALDGGSAAGGSGDGDVTGPGADVATLVVAAREDLEIARQVRELIGWR